ncbi:hypothetical protein FRC02_011342 [Tulasnella sp. 418]|nr:hypothetical protein FRC02_011342 [Tulasnella sp. 418]
MASRGLTALQRFQASEAAMPTSSAPQSTPSRPNSMDTSFDDDPFSGPTPPSGTADSLTPFGTADSFSTSGSSVVPSSFGGTRRPREASLDSDAHRQGQTAKRLMTYAKKVCMDNNLPINRLDSFVALGDISHMLLDIKGHLSRLEVDHKVSHSQRTIESADFKTTIKPTVMACILSPYITSYLGELPGKIVVYMSKNVETFGLSETTFNIPDLVTKLHSVVSDILTECRSSIKTTLYQSIIDEECIKEVARGLAPQYMTVNTAHWARLAYLRQTLIDFDGIIQKTPGSTANSTNQAEGEEEEPDSEITTWTKGTQFWNFVDVQLKLARSEYNHLSPAKQAEELANSRFMTTTVGNDLKTYTKVVEKKKKKRGSNFNFPEVFAWQSSIENALIW